MTKHAKESPRLQAVERPTAATVQIPLPVLGAFASIERSYFDLCIRAGQQVLAAMMEQDGIVKLRPQVAEYADDEPAAQLSRIPIPLRNHQSRRLALLPFRLEFPRCRRSPCRTGYHRDV